MIIVNPTAGLCNRMRVINSAIHLAKLNGQAKIKMLWAKDELLNADFSDLFEPIETIIPVDKSYIHNFYTYYRNQTNRSALFFVKKLILEVNASGYKYYDDLKIKNLRGNPDYWIANHKNVVFDTCYDFFEYGDDTNNYQLFKPLQSIEKRISDQVLKFTEFPSVGIHIRRTDNTASIQNSRTDLFVKRVETILQANDQTRFYLATDDLATEDMFVRNFGDRIVIQTGKDLSRNSKKGIEDAVVDLYSLSRTEYILGSFWSSFSGVASWINNIPLEIIK